MLYTSKHKGNTIYRTNLLDKDNGINYRNFIKVRADVIIKNKIAIIGHEAWLLLFYLSCNAINKEYIKTNVRTISAELDIKSVEKALRKLHNNKFIFINNTESNLDKIGMNDILEIIISYNEDSLFEVEKNAYKALPIQFARYLIFQEKLSSEEFSIYTVLLNYFSWFECKEYSDEETGKVSYDYKTNEYAFPTQEQIGTAIGISRNRVPSIIDVLSNSKLISYDPSDHIKSTNTKEGKNVIRNPNYRYKMELIQRVEYVYFNYMSIPDNRTSEIRSLIKEKGFEAIASSNEQGILKDRDYLEYKYGNILSNFHKAIEKRDYEYYDSKVNENIILGIITKFNNKSIGKLKKKREPYKSEKSVAELNSPIPTKDSDYKDNYDISKYF